MDEGQYEGLLAELDHRNRDNVARTESYLELYARARDDGHELPWLLMAHLVSRSAGYLMTDLAGASTRPSMFTKDAYGDLFLLLERANFLIFHDAWHHVLLHLLGRSSANDERTPRFMREAWARFETSAGEATPARERRLVVDLVTNEQNLIENRVVQNERFERGRAMIGFFEALGREAPTVLPLTHAEIRVGGFATLEQRVRTGERIFDEVLAGHAERDAIFAWATEHPHTGARRVYGARGNAHLRDVWTVDAVRALWPDVHAPPAPDAAWP